MTAPDPMELKACPFCPKGTTEVRENRLPGAFMDGSAPGLVSVEVCHWCEPVEGQPRRRSIVMVGRDRASAIAAWNTRPAAEPPNADVARLIKAAGGFDWKQSALHQGSPCFHLEDDGRFCGRAHSWAGHDGGGAHIFVPLYVAMTMVAKAASEPAADRDAALCPACGGSRDNPCGVESSQKDNEGRAIEMRCNAQFHATADRDEMREALSYILEAMALEELCESSQPMLRRFDELRAKARAALRAQEADHGAV